MILLIYSPANGRTTQRIFINPRCVSSAKVADCSPEAVEIVADGRSMLVYAQDPDELLHQLNRKSRG